MYEERNQLAIALIILIVWMAIVMGGGLLQVGIGGFDSLVTKHVVIGLILAPLFLFGVIRYFNWNRRELGLNAAQDWHLLLFPGLFVLIFLVIAFILGLPPIEMIIFALINSMLVGISEELMFRGIIFRGVLSQAGYRIWSAIWITAILFGVVHVLNGFITGNFITALAQALMAIMSGIWFHAIRIRTRSIYPAMLIHGLWDFSLFVFATSLASVKIASESSADTSMMAKLLLPLILSMPLFIYGLWLLRDIGKINKAEIIA